MTPPDLGSHWRPQAREAGVHLYLSGVDGDASALIGARVCGMPLTLSIVPVTDWIDPTDLETAAVGVVQVDADTPASIKRFEKLAEQDGKPLIAACYDPPLGLVRTLLKAGAHDVLPLPLTLDDLETSIAPLQQEMATREVQAQVTTGRLITVIKSRGGIGATALATQLACRFAASEGRAGRDVCLIDFDVQFGDAAFQLGLGPRLTLFDLVEAGARLDGPMLRSTTVQHPSGLHVAAAPPELLPLDAVSNEQVLAIAERAQREFGTVFVDLPANWTNWSLSLVARSQMVLLVTDLSVAGLNRARRQLKLLGEQGLGDVPLKIIVNRFEKSVFRPVKTGDAATALGREVDFTVANDPGVIGAAIDQGVPIDDIKRRSALARDLDTIDAALAAELGLER